MCVGCVRALEELSAKGLVKGSDREALPYLAVRTNKEAAYA